MLILALCLPADANAEAEKQWTEVRGRGRGVKGALARTRERKTFAAYALGCSVLLLLLPSLDLAHASFSAIAVVWGPPQLAERLTMILS